MVHRPQANDSVTTIFGQVIEQLEGEFDQEVTRTILSLLVSARRGLSDRELLEMVEGPGTKIEESASSLFPILRQLRPYLQHRAELLDFFHRNLYRAACNHYLSTEESKAAAHKRLADYFTAQEYFTESLEEQQARAKRLPPARRPVNIRKVDELPYQRLEVAKLLGKDDAQSPHWDAVTDLLIDWQFIEAKAEAQS